MAQITPTQQRFILHWGEMGTRWGISRTVAQIHALLYVFERPLNAEEISELLSVARSNVSNSLKELQNWGIVKKAPVMGDKRDHFESLHNVWDMFRIILEQRKKREVDPTLELLEECLTMAKQPESEESELTQKRLADLQDFFLMTTKWYDTMSSVPNGVLREVFNKGAFLGSKKTSDS